jgi:hypothetical protein
MCTPRRSGNFSLALPYQQQSRKSTINGWISLLMAGLSWCGRKDATEGSNDAELDLAARATSFVSSGLKSATSTPRPL